MVLVDADGGADLLSSAGEAFPADVEFVLSALEAGPRPAEERQKIKRSPYRVRAMLKLFSDTGVVPPTMLYTRQVNPQAVGFLTSRRLPLSHGGILYIPAPAGGQMLQVYCTILRCREAAPGWYEGAAYFNRRQAIFSAEAMEPGD